MKRIAKYIFLAAAALCAGAPLASCDDELAQAPVEMPAPVIGDGSWENPLQAWQAHLGTIVGERTSNWVTGYIVGFIDTSISNTMKGATIGTDGAVQTNMLIAQYPYDEAEWERLGYSVEDCATVQLPSGAVRSALNLADNPSNFNRQVSLRGTTGSKYCGAYGVRQANDYNWGPKGRYEEPVGEIGDSYFCNFTASRDVNYYLERGWSTIMLKGGLSGWYWKTNSGVCFLSCSAYLGTATGGPYENWVISPAFDLDKAREKTLSFSTQGAYANESTLEVYIMTSRNPQTGNPVKLDCVIAQAPESGYSSWVSSGDIDLSEYSGTVYIGFRYWSAHGGQNGSSDFGITDFNIGGADPAEWEVIDPSTIGKFRRATTIESGKKYAIVFDSNRIMLPLSDAYSYGNFGVSGVKPADGQFESKKDNAFTLTEIEGSEGEYTLMDCYGRYIFMKGTFTNFNVAMTPQEYYRWSLTADEEGIFRILNVSRNVVMIYDAAKGNIGTTGLSFYQGNGAELYELTEE
ncbi:MAG: choice-of-anchor J domain-containing protein [Muribaculaceae bacterium]|nr:choice-of-anchor J domain-containing protein [Muribaculaceae bacterium]